MAPTIFDHFLTPTGIKTGQFKMKSKHCNKPVSGSYAANSNFHTHIKRHHPDIVIQTAASFSAQPSATHKSQATYVLVNPSGK